MKRVAFAMLIGVVAVGLTGCTYSGPGQEQEQMQAETSAFHSVPPATSRILKRTFESQAAATTGTATIELIKSGAILQLDNMATDPGDDLRVM